MPDDRTTGAARREADPTEQLTLLDWRRRVGDVYREVRRAAGSRESWDRWRAVREELFRTHPQTPLDEPDRWEGLHYFDHDPNWRLAAELAPTEPVTAEIGHSGAGATTFRRVAVAVFESPGGPAELDIWWLEAYGGGLFVPFRDSTSGDETYGGGRYLLDTVKGADLGSRNGELVLDFNFAYHPSCVYSDRWSCPLAPPGNVLGVPVQAGERLAPADRG